MARPNHSQFVVRDFPEEFLKTTLEVIFRAYRRAHDHCFREFPAEEAKSVRPFWRRQVIESEWRVAARDFEQIKAECRHSPGNSWTHTLVSAGSCALTQNALESPDTLLRHAGFRSNYAGPDRQTFLFPKDVDDVSPTEQILCVYGVVVHGWHENPRVPTFARIRFLKPNADEYYENNVDLFKMFSDVVKRESSSETPIVGTEEVKPPQVKLKPPKDRRDANEA